MSFVIGVSFGRRTDYSSWVIAEYPRRVGPDWVYLSSLAPDNAAQMAQQPAPVITSTDWPLHVIHVKRWIRGTPYQTMIDDVARLIIPMTLEGKIPARLMVNETEVGQPILNLFRYAALRPIACTITGGTVANWTHKRAVNLPKRDAVMSAVAFLDAGRLRWPDRGEMVQTMETELRNFQMKYARSGPEMFELERQEHDDLVLALAMTTWTLSLAGPRNPLHVPKPRPQSVSVPTNWW